MRWKTIGGCATPSLNTPPGVHYLNAGLVALSTRPPFPGEEDILS